MVDTFGNNIINAITNGSPVKAIYNNGIKVWPSVDYSYYITWEPGDVSGIFTMNNESHYLRTYMGYYTWDTGVINQNVFESVGFTSITTNAYSIDTMAFANCSSLIYANISECGYVGNRAFINCSSLGYVVLTNCSYVGDYAFSGCSTLGWIGYTAEIHLQECSFIGSYAFKNCKTMDWLTAQKISVINEGICDGCNNLTKALFSSLTYIGSYAFRNCSKLQMLDLRPWQVKYVFSYCSYIGSSAFKGCSSMFLDYMDYEPLSLELPVCEYIGNYAFYGCNFTEVSAPMCSSINLHTFDQCNNLKRINLSNCSIISGTMNCSLLSTITLKSTNMVALLNSVAFTGCPNLTSIYVPLSLTTQYKQDSVWSWYSSKIKVISTP